jgi:cysteine-rich repeat protein
VEGAGSESGDAESGSSSGASLESCGDGVLDPGEQCDDGNDVDGDGCNVDCVESGTLRWSLMIDDAQCDLLAADGAGGVYVSAVSASRSWVGRVAPPDGIIWRIPDGPALTSAGPLLDLPDGDGLLAGWGGGFSTQRPGMVSAYDGSGTTRWEITLGVPDGSSSVFLTRARVADGQGSVLVTHSYIIDGGERVTAWHLDAAGQVVDSRVLSEDEGLGASRHAVITGSGTTVLASHFGEPDWISAYASSGELLWHEVLPDTESLNDLDSASDGSIHTITKVANGGAVEEFRVDSYAPDGGLVRSWAPQAPSSDSQAGIALLTIDGRDDVVVAANFLRANEMSLLLAKYSPEGELRWSLPWEAAFVLGNELASRDLIIAANGDVLLVFDDPMDDEHNRCHIVAVTP